MVDSSSCGWESFRLTDLADVRQAIGKTRTSVGRPLLYLSLIRASTRVFTEGEHGALGTFVRDLLSDCEAIHHVIDGAGFVASARRSIVTQLAIKSARPDAFHTYATLEEAAAVIAPRLRMPLAKLLDDARARGLAFPDGSG